MRQYVVSLLVSSLLICSLMLLFGCPSGDDSNNNGTPVTQSVFLEKLLSSERVSILMDLRGAPSAGRDRVLQCGVDFAGSEGIAGKNISVFAFEADSCIGKKNESISDCNSEMKGSPILHVKYGPENSEFFDNKMLVFVNENTTQSCIISVKRENVTLG